MPYFKNNLIARSPGSGLAGFLDTVGEVGKGALTLITSQARTAGQLEATQAQVAAQQAQQRSSGGISTTHLVIGGAAVAGIAFLLLRKK